MLGLVFWRTVRTLIVVLGVLTVVFLLLYLSGDPARLLLPEDASVEDVQFMRQKLGLDRPVPLQWLDFVVDAVRGRFGESFFQKRPAVTIVLERLPATVELAAVALVLSVIIACPVGVLSALRRGSPADALVTTAALTGRSMPTFWVGIMLMIMFSVHLGWLPVSGRGTPAHLVLPAVTLAMFMAPLLIRLVRSAVLEVMGEDFIRTARAKGLPERVVLYRHGLRNAALPLVTMIGLQAGALLGGTVITETVFAWPGLGRLVVLSVTNLDYPVVRAGTAFLAVAIAVINLAVDLLYGYLDPRVRIR